MTKPGTRLRILLVIDTYPPQLGGSEIEAQRVSAGLIRRGHQVEVICSGAPLMPPMRDWIDPEGVPVTILARGCVDGPPKDRAFAIEVARDLWRRRKSYDVVYFLMQGLQVLTGLPVARSLRKPIVMKIAGSGVIPLMRRQAAGRFELDWLQNWKVPLLLLNQGMMEEAIADGFVREQLAWMPNPVDVDVFRPPLNAERQEWRVQHNLAPDARVVIYVGRLAHEKGLPGLLRGFAEAARRAPNAVLLLVGDGSQRPELEALVTELALAPGRIRFTGRAPGTDIPRWLGASDVFALTSPREGLPCAVLEAMAAGLPSVVSAIPANLQLIDDGVHGLTVGWDDADAIGQAFTRVLGDKPLCTAMGAAARERAVVNFSTNVVLDMYEKLFAAVIAGKPVS
jgi:glycosyltransferase involved in cell wall biosynthesis